MTDQPHRVTDDRTGPDPAGTGEHADSGGGPPVRRRRGVIRRRVLITAGSVLGLGALTGGAYGLNFTLVYRDRKLSNVGELDFSNRVAIPRLLEPDKDARGRRHFELKARPGTSTLLPGKKTPTWGVNGAFLGPTLRARREDTVSVTFSNGLPETTSLHWHGMHLPADMDGGPHQAVSPGGVWRPTWRVDQPAATLWYHPHPHGDTADHATRGIAGMFILEDEHSEDSGLPKTYGVDDVPLILQDRAFQDDGSFSLKGTSFREEISGVGTSGVLGDKIFVNGTYNPHLNVATTLLRLRVLNASNARVYNLGFTDGRSFHLVAQESGLVPAPVQLRRLQLSPAERAEIVVPFEPGDRVVLRSYAPDLGVGFPSGRLDGGEDTFDLLQLRAAKKLRRSAELPAKLSGAPQAIKEPSSAHRRDFELSGFQINGRTMDMNRIDQVAPAKAVEVWDVQAIDGTPHSFHVHGTSFSVIGYGGEPTPERLRGLKDTVYLPSQKTVRLAVPMPEYTDPGTPYMFHCHMLKHEDQGMMGQFTVVKPGTERSAPRRVPGGHH
ncbi:multicopper oxidase domain-containing protein [Streptomyces sp. NBC_01186]|uniref:multicopper oxidase family protein n=1 Tax=Streptomyces sp. NBC_01186 TaxID=2903765 RepID=UPI002E15F730|nr:multicopper oxidase domain-containing protein [Streptomyces sp. NBC_01186]